MDKFESCNSFFLSKILKSNNLNTSNGMSIIKKVGPLINMAIRLVIIKKIYE